MWEWESFIGNPQQVIVMILLYFFWYAARKQIKHISYPKWKELELLSMVITDNLQVQQLNITLINAIVVQWLAKGLQSPRGPVNLN